MTTYNIKGFMVGNGVTNWDYDVFASTPETFYGFNMVPKDLYEKYQSMGCVEPFNQMRPTNGTDPAMCDKLFNQMGALVAPLNWYDLYRHVYPAAAAVTEEERMGMCMIGGEEKPFREGMRMSEYARFKNDIAKKNPLFGGIKVPSAGTVLNMNLSSFINQPKMRIALNISDDIQPFEQCTSNPKFNYHYQQEGSMWIYQVLKGSGIRMMFYSGDTDGMVPLSGTRKWIKELNWTVKEAWRPWMTNNQVSGYVVRYDGLDFITLKGVGHMAPQWARQPVQEMITNWIKNDKI